MTRVSYFRDLVMSIIFFHRLNIDLPISQHFITLLQINSIDTCINVRLTGNRGSASNLKISKETFFIFLWDSNPRPAVPKSPRIEIVACCNKLPDVEGTKVIARTSATALIFTVRLLNDTFTWEILFHRLRAVHATTAKILRATCHFLVKTLQTCVNASFYDHGGIKRYIYGTIDDLSLYRLQ